MNDFCCDAKINMRSSLIYLVFLVSFVLFACGDSSLKNGDYRGLRFDRGLATQLQRTRTPQADSMVNKDENNKVESGAVWTIKPAALAVWQPGQITYRLDKAPLRMKEGQCVVFLDEKEVSDECEGSIPIAKAERDYHLTLEYHSENEVDKTEHTVMLERLEVKGHASVSDDTDGVKKATGVTRIVFLSDTHEWTEELKKSIHLAIARFHPDLIFHLGGLADDSGSVDWQAVREMVVTPAMAADIPLFWAMGVNDLKQGAQVRRPMVNLADGRHYPAYYSFSYQSNYFIVIGQSESGDVPLEWLKTELVKAQSYTTRFVLAHRPLHAFFANEDQAIERPLDIYELCLRGQVTHYISGASRTFFPGRYGALSILSVGALDSAVRALGDNNHAYAGVTVMDIRGGEVVKVNYWLAPDFQRRLDIKQLPEAVEVYTRDGYL